MKIVLKRKAVACVEEDIQRLVVDDFDSPYDAFQSVWCEARLLKNLGILGNKELDMLWNQLVRKTGVKNEVTTY